MSVKTATQARKHTKPRTSSRTHLGIGLRLTKQLHKLGRVHELDQLFKLKRVNLLPQVDRLVGGVPARCAGQLDDQLEVGGKPDHQKTCGAPKRQTRHRVPVVVEEQ